MDPLKRLIQPFALVFAGALLAALILPLATHPSGAAQTAFTISPGDSIVLNCATKLSGTVKGQQATVKCAAPATTATAAATATSAPAPTATSAPAPTAAPAPTSAPAPGGANSFVETFEGQPASPQPWKPINWDVVVHSRDVATWDALEPMQAMHGSDCAGPPATHAVSSYDDAVFLCRDHLMTAINASGYGVIYFTPNQMVDFANGEATVRFDMSTMRMSQRDWVDLWIMPYQDNLQLPLEPWLPDLSGEPRNAIHIRMDTGNSGTVFKVFAIKDFAETQIAGDSWTGYETFLTPDHARRDTFELRISRTHIKFGMPAYNFAWVDANIPDLGWSRGVVQFGHHSYNPTKSDGCGTICQPGTWHWDNIGISPAAPFTILRASQRVVGPRTGAGVTFAAPAPANASLRFSGIGNGLQVSFDGGKSWQAAQMQAQQQVADEHFKSYWMPVPAGATGVQFRGSSWWGGEWQARDIAIWAPQ